jgi:hypothetical protein
MRNLWILSLLVAGACHHAGGGSGTLESAAGAAGSKSEGPVTFTWQSGADPSQGQIEASLPNGTQFTGTFLQVTSSATVDDYGMYYGAWTNPGWGAPWYDGPEAGFVTAYSGRAVAHLSAANGTKMRCKFTLRDPASGMTGGGEGDCQLSDNQTVFDANLTRGQ